MCAHYQDDHKLNKGHGVDEVRRVSWKSLKLQSDDSLIPPKLVLFLWLQDGFTP